MTANAVLQLPELSDHILHFLQGSSPDDLRSCAIVARALTYSAQRHLFHDIILPQGPRDINTIGVAGYIPERKACRRLCSVLKASPRLIPLVRRLRATLTEVYVVEELSRMKFPNLKEVVFHSTDDSTTKERSLVAVAEIVGLPSIRRVGLQFPCFHSLQDLTRIFEQCPPHLDSLSLQQITVDSLPTQNAPILPARRPVIKHLDVHLSSQVFGPFCPFDFSSLEDPKCHLSFFTQDDAGTIEHSRETLKRLYPYGVLNLFPMDYINNDI